MPEFERRRKNLKLDTAFVAGLEVEEAELKRVAVSTVVTQDPRILDVLPEQGGRPRFGHVRGFGIASTCFDDDLVSVVVAPQYERALCELEANGPVPERTLRNAGYAPEQTGIRTKSRDIRIHLDEPRRNG